MERSIAMRPGSLSLVAVGLLLSVTSSAVAAPLTSAFTYQGRLTQGGSALNGTADF